MEKEKKILIGLSIVLTILGTMTAFVSSKRKKEYQLEVARTKEIQEKLREKCILDSIRKAELQEKYIENFKDSIEIIEAKSSAPNSAGGVDLEIVWKNKTSRKIKYARFLVSAFNAVDDEVYSRYSNGYAEWVRDTGPVNPNQIQGTETYWECLWYNHSIKYCKIRLVEVEFFDGQIVEIPLL